MEHGKIRRHDLTRKQQPLWYMRLSNMELETFATTVKEDRVSQLRSKNSLLLKGTKQSIRYLLLQMNAKHYQCSLTLKHQVYLYPCKQVQNWLIVFTTTVWSVKRR